MRHLRIRLAIALVINCVLLPVAAFAQAKLHPDSLVWEIVSEDDFGGIASAATPTVPLNTTAWRTTPTGNPDDGVGAEYYSGESDLVTISQGAAHIRSVRIPDRPRASGAAGFHTVKFRAGQLFGTNVFHQAGYGIWEARMKVPNNIGAWPTFWLCSSNNTLEIDILDGTSPDGMLVNVIDHRKYENDYKALPYPFPRLSKSEYRVKPWVEPGQTGNELLDNNYHTYAMAWTPSEITFFFDGRAIYSVPASVVTAIELGENNWPDLRISMQMWDWASGNGEVMDVDYVRIWKPFPNKAGVRDYAVATSTYMVPGERP